MSDTRSPSFTALEALALAGIVVLFVVLCLTNVNFPGLFYDETIDAVPTVQMLTGQPVESLRGSGLWLGPVFVPLMVSDYVGTVNTLLLLPFLAAFGPQPIAFRLMTMLVGMAALLLYYAFTREFLGRPAALITALLLAVHPSYVFWSRQGIYLSSTMTVAAGGSLWALFRWHRRRQWRWLLLGGFFLGLGISAKFLFLWFILALTGAYWLVVGIPRLWRRDVRGFCRALFYDLSPGQLLAGGLAWCAGASLFIIYNLQTQGTFHVLFDNVGTTSYGVSNLNFLDNFLTQLHHLRTVLEGSFFWFIGGPYANPIYPAAFVAALVLLFVLTLGPFRDHWRRFLFLFTIFGVMLVESCFTISGLWETHLLVFLPLPQMMMALCLVLLTREGLRWARQREWGWLRPAALTGAALVLIALVGTDVWVDAQYHRDLPLTGGYSRFSDAIHEVVAYLDARNDPHPVAMDWGLSTTIYVLTWGRIQPVEIFEHQPEPSPDFYEKLRAHMQDPATLYLFNSGDVVVYDRFPQWEAMVKELGKTIILEKTFKQRDGDPIFNILRAE
ncbi:MAG: glycosyltransferase family 39 protein [Chloroflexi bacterium]|nr:glycosyltransferase family 39 protein [Chloroflexota bacterium]MBU1748033.1 glycosyltransferase family 39 protein [Chloroflexota bacterium]